MNHIRNYCLNILANINGFIELDDSKWGLCNELSKKYLNEFDIEI